MGHSKKHHKRKRKYLKRKRFHIKHLRFCDLPTVTGLSIVVVNYAKKRVTFQFVQREPKLRLISTTHVEPSESATIYPKVGFYEGILAAVDCDGCFLAAAVIQVRNT